MDSVAEDNSGMAKLMADIVQENVLNAAPGMPASVSSILALSICNTDQGFLGPPPVHVDIPH